MSTIDTNLTLPRVELDFMNADHNHAVEVWQRMLAALDTYPQEREPLAAACRAFLIHNREHFAREEEVMRQTGFPPLPVHKAEHDRVLAWLEEVAVAVEAGRPREALAQAIARDIPAWLQQHVQSMDLVTARFVASRQKT